MALDRIEFDNFIFDASERRLSRIDGSPVDLAGRNFDALALLIAEAGKLVSKDRFMDEVWRGVPVTDEALTQAIRSLRRTLGDDATRPRFIETVPKFGYRFVATVNSETEESTQSAPSYTISQPYTPLQQFLATGLSGTAGGALAGLVGGLIYGFAGAAGSSAGGGALSILLVLLMLTVALATIGAAAVSFGIAAAEYFRAGHWALTSIGGATGGLIIGAFAQLLGMDSFNLLFGAAPQDITGASEGVMLGAAAGTSLWLCRHFANRFSRPLLTAAAALIGIIAGVVIVLSGGQLLAGSLAMLIDSFPQANLRMNGLETAGFGPTSRMVTAAFEAALFCGCVTVAITALDRRGTARR